ncbi:MAG: FtsX-like permease family protein [Bacteroidota bacterium]
MNFDLTVVGNRDSLYIFLCIAILVLAIACINYINMATARAANRAKEIGVRKVNGALRVDLIVQFLSEAFLSVIIAAVIAASTVALLVPTYNQFLTKEISIDFLLQPTSIALAALLLISVALIAGAYPCIFILVIQTDTDTEGSIRQSHNSRLRNALVIFQFVVSGTLVFGTLLVWKQLEYVKNKDIGFNRDHIVIVALRDVKLKEKHAEIREDVASQS